VLNYNPDYFAGFCYVLNDRFGDIVNLIDLSSESKKEYQ
jgi:hypothetical protein